MAKKRARRAGKRTPAQRSPKQGPLTTPPAAAAAPADELAAPSPAKAAPTPPKGRPTPSARDRRGAQARGRARRRGAKRAGVIAVGVAVFAGVIAFALTSSSGRDASASVTDPARFDLPGLDGGGRVKLADFHGRPTVVNFFASWCTTCDQELPGFAKVSRELRGKVNFVGVNSLETGDELYMPERHHITWWPLAGDVSGNQDSGLHDALCQCNSMPVTAFYSPEGKLLTVDQAGLPESALRQRLQQLYGISG